MKKLLVIIAMMIGAVGGVIIPPANATWYRSIVVDQPTHWSNGDGSATVVSHAQAYSAPPSLVNVYRVCLEWWYQGVWYQIACDQYGTYYYSTFVQPDGVGTQWYQNTVFYVGGGLDSSAVYPVNT